MPSHHQVLVVDTEPDFLNWCAKHLSAPTVQVLTCNDSETALKLVEEKAPDLVITELLVPPFNGMDLLRRLRQQDPKAMVILNTGFLDFLLFLLYIVLSLQFSLFDSSFLFYR